MPLVQQVAQPLVNHQIAGVLALQPATDFGIDITQEVTAGSTGIDHLGHTGIVVEAQAHIRVGAPFARLRFKPVGQVHGGRVSAALQDRQVEVEIRCAA